MTRKLAALVASAAALMAGCTPQAKGVCSKDSDCASQQRCFEGLCLAISALPDGGHPDAGDGGSADGGDAGAPDAGCLGAGCALGLVLEAPAAGAFVTPTFHVKAQASSADTPQDVTFELTADPGGASLGSLVVAQAAPGQTYEGDLAASATSGSALLKATVHVGARSFTADPIRVVIDDAAPQIDTTWDDSTWVSGTGTFVVPGTVSDDHGVASAQLIAQLPDGGTLLYPGAISGGEVTFTVLAINLVVPGAAAGTAAQLSATDLAGNTALREKLSLLKVDDEKPAVGAVADSLWHNAGAVVLVSGSDTASGLASLSLSVNGSAPIPGQLAGGSASITVSVADYAAPGFEGPLPFRAIATDNVGNSADAGGVLLVDLAPPAVTSLAAFTAPDQQPKWFRARSAPDLTVQASFDAGAGAPLDGTSVRLGRAGVALVPDPNQQAYTFAVPRDAGVGVEGPVAFTATAQDLAGNVGSGQLVLWFDDLPPQLGASAWLPDGGAWVARRLPDGGPAFPEVDVGAVDQGVGVAAVTLYTADGGAPLSDAGTAPDAGVYALGLDVRSAGAGAAAAFPFLATAVDNFGNALSAPYAVGVDDAPPVITQPNADVDSNWHSGLAGSTTSQITVIATIDDQGSGVFAAPALALPDGGVVSAAHLLSGGTAAHGRWQFDAFSAPADPSLNGLVTLTAVAVDGVGNAGTSGQAIKVNVDNVPPSPGTPAYVADGNGYFRGPSVALGGDPATLDVALPFTEAHPASAAATLPDASTVQGQLQGDGKFHFAIPRAIGAGGGKRTVGLKVIDQAGNSAQTSVDLFFEDAAPSLTGVADSSWHSQQNGAIPAAVTLAAVPPSGVASAVLNAGSAQSCKGSGTASPNGLTYAFSFPGSCAPGATEGYYMVTMTVTSGAGVPASAPTWILIDGAPPTVDVESVLYPAAGGALGYSHDGAHFNLREGNVGLVSFLTWDCGGGLAASQPTSYSVSGTPATRSASCQSTGSSATCAVGTAPKVRCTVSADLATAPAWTYPLLDNQVAVQLAATDVFSHQGAGATNINLTRRLWQSGGIGALRAAAGPSPIVYVGGSAGLFAFDRNTGGGTQWTSAIVQYGPAVAPNGGDPLVYWIDGSSSAGQLRSASAASAYTARGSCSVSASQGSFAPKALLLLNDSRAATSRDWQTSTQSCVCDTGTTSCIAAKRCSDPDTGDPGCTKCTTTIDSGTDSYALRASGCESSPLTYVGPGAILGVGGWEYSTGGGNLTALQPTTGMSSSVASTATRLAAFYAGNATDAVAGSDSTRHDFNGAWGSTIALSSLQWPFSVTAYGPGLIVGNVGGSWGVMSTGGTAMGQPLATASSTVAPTIDDSGAVGLAYLASPSGGAASLLAAPLTANGGLGQAQFTIPFAASIDDVTLTADGALLIVSGGALSVITTDSPGLRTSSGGLHAWPAPGRDACKSFNLDFACPY